MRLLPTLQRASRPMLATLLLALPTTSRAQQAPADLIVHNARIYTVDDARPVVEALAVRDGHVAFAGSRIEAEAHPSRSWTRS